MPSIDTASPWDQRPLGALIDHIVAAYHRPQPAELARLQALAEHLPGGAVAAGLAGLRELLREHTRREEELVFPWLRGGNQRSAGLLVNLLEHEHGDIERGLRDLTRLCAPDAAEPDRVAARVRRELAAGLRAFERTLDVHLRLENRVLFPRALVGVLTPG